MIVRSYSLFLPLPDDPLFISDDFGQTWTNIFPNGLVLASGLNKASITVDPYNSYNSVITLGPQVFKSIDGGYNYSVSTGAGSANGFHRSFHKDSTHVIVVGDTIGLSTDGGSTFTNYGYDPVVEYGPTIVPPSLLFIRSVYFENVAVGYMNIYDKLYRSGDGGITWTVIYGDNPIESGFRITGISSEGNYITIINGNGIYHSSDSGVTFNLVEGPFAIGTPTDDNALNNPWRNPAVLYATEFATGPSTNVYKSIDYGATWTLVGTLPNTANIDCIHAYSATNLYIIDGRGPADIYKSTDSFSTSTITLSTLNRTVANDSGYAYNCGECPNVNFTYNPVTEQCELVEEITICNMGYLYDPITKTCISTTDPEDVYTPSLCPPDCTTILGDDQRGLCECIEIASFIPCCYRLDDCAEVLPSIITQTDLSDYASAANVLNIQGSDACWTVTKIEDSLCSENVDVIVTEVFESCVTCNPSYTLYNCRDNSVTIDTAVDFSESLTKTIKLVEYPNECWQVGPNTKAEFTPEEVTMASEFQSCAICNPPLYQLNNCFNDDSFIITDSDLLNLIGKTISIQGYPGLCFTVTEPTCQCLRVTGIFDIQAGTEETVDVTASTVLVNGRYQYLFTSNGSDYSIVWNNDPAQWEFYNVTTSTMLFYSPIDSSCPYTSYWIPVLGEIIYTYALQDGSLVSGGFQAVYVSTDFGATYDLYFDGLPVSTTKGEIIKADRQIIGSVFAAGPIGIYHTTDHGFSWAAVGGSYTTGGEFNDILLYNDILPTDLSIAVGDTFAVSTDGGLTFSDLADSPATLYPTWGPSPQAYAIASWDLTTIYVSVEDKIFKSIDLGLTWTACNSDNPISVGNRVQDIVTLGFNVIIAITTTGIYQSADFGATFTQTLTITENVIGSGNSLSNSGSADVVYYPASFGEVGGIYRTTNSGATWTLQSTITGTSGSTSSIFSYQQKAAMVGRSAESYYTTDYGVTKDESIFTTGKPTSLTGTIEYTSCQPFCASLIKTESCSDLIYDINVDQVFSDCECCTTKNCK